MNPLTLIRIGVELAVGFARTERECWRIIGAELHALRVQREQNAVRSRNKDADASRQAR